MGFKKSIGTCLDKYIDFSGRATRSEFWFFILFLALVNSAGTLVFGAHAANDKFVLRFGIAFGLGSDESWWTNIFTALFILPLLSAMTRRLNDTNFPVGKFVAVAVFVFILLSFASKVTNDQLPILLVVIPLFSLGLFFIYLLARKSFPGTSIHGSSPHEVPS